MVFCSLLFEILENLETAAVFPLICCVLNMGTTGTIFNVVRVNVSCNFCNET